ncbi:hypothetical protein [Nodosilinea sp. FACHB-13]|uniref:hypothetical protein n=1 Tax=Cyanophyceae TaxID=3028117 RepID=UPI0016883A7D|nr:hypothetical protein [Nodosilinea sp. FACHB-13]MBD2110044.1 hypothetical protein [Nodosilinea sp. FACHB-13]
MPPNGKTLSLLSRLPDFYATGEGSALHTLAAALGDALEGAETDLIRVLRSRFVDTASNSSTHSPNSAHQGDLDRLFALYLERLGGTSQLVQVNNQFQPRDLLELETLVTAIVRPQTALGYDLQAVGRTQSPDHFTQLARYDVDPAHRRDLVHITPATWLQPANLLTRLLIGRDPLLQYLQSRLSDATQVALNRYTGTNEVPTDLLEAFTADLNRLLSERAFTQAMYHRLDYLRLGQALQSAWFTARDRLTQDPAFSFTTDDLPQALARYLRKKLPLPLQKQIFWQQLEDGFSPNELSDLVTRLQPDLSSSLPHAAVWQPLLDVAQNQATVTPAPDNMRLSLVVVTALLQAATQAMLIHVVGPDGQFPTLQADALAQLARYAPATPSDRIRHNRLCLEASYPSEISCSGIPTEASVRETLTTFLNQVILPDAELYPRNKNFFKLLLLDLETQDLIQASEAKPPLDARLQRRLNRLLLESAFPTALQKSYVPYRERLRDLIQVLMRGASTQQGILDIVAANLGIFADSEAALEARKAITIQEYQPTLESKQVIAFTPLVKDVPDLSRSGASLPNRFTLSNLNVEPTAITLHLELTDQRPIRETSLAPLSQLTLVNAATDQPYFTYGHGLRVGDRLLLLTNGRLFRNGISMSSLPALVLPVGESQWYITARIGAWPGRLDGGQFDSSRFEQEESTVETLTAEQGSNYGFTIGYDQVKLTPGFFQVNVPWDIPGFTDRFDDNTDHPRRQIPSIINRVRAAGTHFAIAYTKTFRENHAVQTQLSLLGHKILKESHALNTRPSPAFITSFQEHHGLQNWLTLAPTFLEHNNVRSWLTVIPADRTSHPLFDQLTIQSRDRPPHFVEEQSMGETLKTEVDQSPTTLEHAMNDRLLFSGMFDYTEFDSGNTFA